MAGQHAARVQSLRPGARQRVGGQQGAGDLIHAVDAVGVAGHAPRCRARRPARRRGRAGTRCCGRRVPAGPWPHGDGGLAAGQQHGGGGAAVGRARGRCGRCRPSRCPSARASPSSASPRIIGVRPRLRAVLAAMASSAIIGVAIMRKSACGRLPGFGVSSASCASRAATAGGRADAVARDQGAGLGEGGARRGRWGRSRSPPDRRPARR